MISLFRRVLYALLWDELAFRRWARGGLLAFAGGGIAFADQLAALVGQPEAVKAIKLASIIAGFVAGAISHGEPNPKAIP